MKRVLGLSIVVMLASVSAGTGESMRILTYPTGLVVGDLEVKADLGSEGAPAELFLDGQSVCTMTARKAECTVALGPDPHVHLLELRRPDGSRAERWVNRPGEEAELELLVVPSSGSQQCELRIAWAHPLKQDPVELSVTLDGAPLQIGDSGHSVRFPCRPEKHPVLVASGVFPDGRRVEAAAVIGEFVERTSVELAAAPLVSGSEDEPSCVALRGIWSERTGGIEEDSGFEVVLVLDPGASYRNLYTSGWHIGRLPTLDVTAKADQEIFQKGPENAEPKPKTSWQKAKATLFEAERLWYVAPDSGLHRVNGFAAGRAKWLDLLFKFGMSEIKGDLRIADAVAASGLVAGAGPRRAVVLILGNNVHKRDGSQFTPRQAREYLAEVGVPLLVLRNGKVREDGWPTGLMTLDMEAMSRNLRTVQEVLERQCLAWIPSHQFASLLLDGMPEGVHLAGRGGEAPSSPPSAWAQAEVEAAVAATEKAVAERIDVTAITVLVSAVDEDGLPVIDLVASDLEPVEDGKPVTVLELGALGGAVPEDEAVAEPVTEGDQVAPIPRADPREIPVAVYVDRVLGGGADQRGAIRAVEGEIRRLVALGPVEVVARERGGVRSVIGPTRDATAVAEALDELKSRTPATHAVESIRRDFARRISRIPDRLTEAEVEAANEESQVGVETLPGGEVWFGVKAAASEEEDLLSRAINELRLWALKNSEHRAGLVLVLGVGFDEDPTLFYQPFVERQETHNAQPARAALRERRQTERVDTLARDLAGIGWRVLSVAGVSFGSTNYSADTRSTRFQEFLSASSGPAASAQESEFLLVDPIGTQRHLASTSGGDVVIGVAGLRSALDAASGWYLLTYQVARPPDGATHALELRPRRAGLELKASRLVTDITAEGRSEGRVLRLFAGAPDLGELPVTLTVGAPTATETLLRAEIDATVEFGPLAPMLNQAGSTPLLLVSVATAVPGSEPIVVHRREQLAEVMAGWIYSFPVEWPAGTGGRVAVTVQELTSGVWGGAVVELPAEPPGRPAATPTEEG
jgi:hypothetical protein